MEQNKFINPIQFDHHSINSNPLLPLSSNNSQNSTTPTKYQSDCSHNEFKSSSDHPTEPINSIIIDSSNSFDHQNDNNHHFNLLNLCNHNQNINAVDNSINHPYIDLCNHQSLSNHTIPNLLTNKKYSSLNQKNKSKCNDHHFRIRKISTNPFKLINHISPFNNFFLKLKSVKNPQGRKKSKIKPFEFFLNNLKQDFLNLPNLADINNGCRIIFASNEVIESSKNLIKDHEFSPYNNGIREWNEKSWVTARRRTYGHDFVILQLSYPAKIIGIQIDSRGVPFDLPIKFSLEGVFVRVPDFENHLLSIVNGDTKEFDRLKDVGVKGNFFTTAEINCVEKHIETFLEQNNTTWIELIPAASLVKESQNYFRILGDASTRTVSCIRLNIFPDGGLRRLRVFGETIPDKLDAFQTGEELELNYEENGALLISYSGSVLGHPKNLMRNHALNHRNNGWLTARNPYRPCFFDSCDKLNHDEDYSDFCIFRLAHIGYIFRLHFDCSVYVGEMPNYITLQYLNRPDIFVMDYSKQQRLFQNSPGGENDHSLEWKDIFRKAKLNSEGKLDVQLIKSLFASHIRLSLIPDGGISSFKAIGKVLMNTID